MNCKNNKKTKRHLDGFSQIFSNVRQSNVAIQYLLAYRR